MLSCFPFRFSGKSAGKLPFKICDVDRKEKIGICVRSIDDLKIKISNKFEIPESVELNIVLEEDGTELDDEELLLDLPSHTTFMFLQNNETWTPAPKNTADVIEYTLSALLQSNNRHKVSAELMKTIGEKDNHELLQLMGQIVNTIKQNIQANTRQEDPDWFKGQPANKITKDAVMRECARRRIRKYYYMTMDYVKSKKKGKISAEYQKLLNNFKTKLKVNDYHGDYFDRNASQPLCDTDGWFFCEGPYNTVVCPYTEHRINPYGSHINYVVFSTWNFDHRIEKSRVILPELIIAQDEKPKDQVLNWSYFYDILFTRKNLCLVHISCHDKTEHDSEKCDQEQYYL